MMTRLTQMLEMQRELQRNSYNVDPGLLGTRSEGIQYIKDMVLAAEDELHEILGEVDWKPWTQGERKINHDGVKKEIVDLWHFMMNLMLVVNMSSDELYTMYMKKCAVNAERQRNGYDGRSTKCFNCKRAFEDVTLTEIKKDGTNITELVFCQCGAPIDLRVVAPFLIE